MSLSSFVRPALTNPTVVASTFVGVMMLLTAHPASAFLCASTSVSAQGEPSAYEWLAKTKARANWRSRVRATRELGPTYSNWSRAQEKLETCSLTQRGMVCSFTATPCKL
jgi:hypothetical protein